MILEQWLLDGKIVKRKKIDFKSLITYENIYMCYKEVKNNCKNETAIFNFSLNLSQNLNSIVQDLYFARYKFSGYNVFLIKENKYRIIMSECVSDKIVSLFFSKFILIPLLDKTLIDQNVATRLGKGSKDAYYFLEKYIRKIGLDKQVYALKLDYSKYFYTIDHEILKSKLNSKIKDKLFLSYLFNMIDLTDDDYVNDNINTLKENEIIRIKRMNILPSHKDSLINEVNSIPIYKKGVGISIGSVVNQTLAIFFTDEIDKFIKETLKCKCYLRYMDDCICLSDDKDYLKYCYTKILFKSTDLGLKINPKSNIYLVNNSLTFLGYTYFIRNGKLVKRVKSVTYKKINKKLKFLRENDFSSYYLSKSSYKGIVGLKFFSIYEEAEYLFQKYSVPVVNNDEVLFCLDNFKKMNPAVLIKFFEKNMVKYIYLEENKFLFS